MVLAQILTGLFGFAAGGGGGQLIGDVASPKIDFSRNLSRTTTIAPTTTETNTFSDSRTFQIITNSPNSSASASPQNQIIPQVAVTPTIIPTTSRDITPVASPASSGGGSPSLTSLLVIGGIGYLGYKLIVK